MSTDQNGAMNPDISSPFSSKADACKRLVRYHCYNQPILSEKDLNKADEIFELTARHFIEKFRMMVNKYKYLLLKESMVSGRSRSSVRLCKIVFRSGRCRRLS